MKRLFSLLAVLSLFVVVARAGDSRVILITVDGFPARYLEDSKAHLPRIRQLAAEGASARGMKVSNPSITWPNHTTLVSGVRPRKHSVLFNGLLERGPVLKVNGEKTAAELVAVPTIFDILHSAGMKTAGVNWPCTRSSRSLDDDFPDSPQMLNFTTPRLREELVSAGILKSEKQEDFATIGQPARDEIWTQTAIHLIRKRMPNFMAVHLLNTDGTHHKYGPETPAGYTALTLADRMVGEIVDAVKAAGQSEKTTIIITSDHGFANATNTINPNAVLRKAGLLEVSSLGMIVNARVQVISEGGSGLIYLNNPGTREEDRKKVIELFSAMEGVAEIIGPERFAALGMPDAGQGGMGDLILRPKPGYGVSATTSEADASKIAAGNAGYHGYLSEDSAMNAAFVASGRNIKKGARLETMENVDVAPTIMKLLGKDLPTSDGRVLTEILK